MNKFVIFHVENVKNGGQLVTRQTTEMIGFVLGVVLSKILQKIQNHQNNCSNISKTVQFLINNDNITGQIIPVDSGQSIAWLTPDIINIKE